MSGQNSINTNVGAMVALRNLNMTNTTLGEVQNRVSTGLKVIRFLGSFSFLRAPGDTCPVSRLSEPC